MNRRVKGTLKLFVWLSLIVIFTSCSVTSALARMPARGSTIFENSRLRDHTTRTKIITLGLDSKTLSSGEKFEKTNLSAQEMKALKSAVTKAAKSCSMLEGDSWWGCMKGCLADVGVTPYSLIICGATCAAGAVPICAVCLGVTVAVLEACGVGCALYNH